MKQRFLLRSPWMKWGSIQKRKKDEPKKFYKRSSKFSFRICWFCYCKFGTRKLRTELTAYQSHLNLIKTLFHSFMNVKWDVDKVFCLYSEPNRTNMAPKVLDNWSMVYQKKNGVKEFVGLSTDGLWPLKIVLRLLSIRYHLRIF